MGGEKREWKELETTREEKGGEGKNVNSPAMTNKLGMTSALLRFPKFIPKLTFFILKANNGVSSKLHCVYCVRSKRRMHMHLFSTAAKYCMLRTYNTYAPCPSKAVTNELRGIGAPVPCRQQL
jgi:hypothetical protein